MQLRVLPFLFLSLPVASLAEPPKTKTPAAPAVAATPAKAPPAAGGNGLISSEVSGKDLIFIANALDLGKALDYLSAEAAKASNQGLRNLSEGLGKSLSENAAVVSTIAEMRGIKIPAQSPTQKRLAEKLDKLSGPKREKVLLDMFIEVDERMVATYDLGRKSSDPTILKLSGQAFPQTQEHLYLVQGLTGMAPKRPAARDAVPSLAVAKVTPERPAPAPILSSDSPVAPPPKGVATQHPNEAPKEPAPPKPAPVAETKVPEAPKAEPPAPKPQVAEAPAPISELPPLPPPANKVAAKDPLPPKPAAPPKVDPIPAKPAVAEAKPKASAPPAPKPMPIGEAPVEDVAPKKLEADPKPTKRPAFRMNVKPPSE